MPTENIQSTVSVKTARKGNETVGEESTFQKTAEQQTVPSDEPQVVLIDFQDHAIGTMGKQQAHEEGRLHRAFSVFLCHDDRILLQKRAAHKYHCGGLWTNTCCSHPAPGEEVLTAARRRLKEELGIRITELEEIHAFVYRYPFTNGLTEFEYDHILIGEYDGPFTINPEEVEDVRWISIQDLRQDILLHPESYTPWFITALTSVTNKIKRN